MTQLKNTLLAFALFALILGVVYGLGYVTAHSIWKARWNARPTVEVQTDTVFVRDTIREAAPKPQTVKVRDTILVAVTDTVFVHRGDSTFVPAMREVKTYAKPDYYAVVSGVQPSLDFIEIYRKNQVITNTVTKTLPAPRWSFSATAGPTVGYGYTPAGAQPFIGVGLTVGVAYRF